MTEAEAIIARLGLQPHPEGGWYRQTWVGPEVAGRASGTAILFRCCRRASGATGTVSMRRKSDTSTRARRWCCHWRRATRARRRITGWGRDVLAGDQPQVIVPPQHWQAARSMGAWSLVGCTVSPGFRFDGSRWPRPASRFRAGDQAHHGPRCGGPQHALAAGGTIG